MSDLERRLLTHCGDDYCEPCLKCCMLMREAAEEIERLQSELDAANTRFTEMNTPTGREIELQEIAERLQSRLHEATKAGTPYAADRDAMNSLVVENQRLQAIVDRLPTTAEGAPVVQTSMQKVWRTHGAEGRPQMCEYFQNGFAVFRGATHNEMVPIVQCYSTREAAERKVSVPLCAVCQQPVGPVSRTFAPGVEVCMKCNPFRRCGRIIDGKTCLGIMEHAGTPNDMGRLVCDVCGREDRA